MEKRISSTEIWTSKCAVRENRSCSPRRRRFVYAFYFFYQPWLGKLRSEGTEPDKVAISLGFGMVTCIFEFRILHTSNFLAFLCPAPFTLQIKGTRITNFSPHVSLNPHKPTSQHVDMYPFRTLIQLGKIRFQRNSRIALMTRIKPQIV